MKIHLVTYGDARYAKLKASFIETAVASSFFDEIHSFSHLDLDPVFYHQIYAPVKSQRGGGYWIWKPYFVKKVLDTLADDDVLVYCDAGSMININGKKRFNEYLEMLFYTASGTVDFSLSFYEYQYTKQEVFNYFNAADDVINSLQLVGGILMMKKSPHTTMMVNEWYHTAVYHPFLFNDEKTLPQRKEFVDHRHDQSIFSVIRKTCGANAIRNETSFTDLVVSAKPFPFWATQLKA